LINQELTGKSQAQIRLRMFFDLLVRRMGRMANHFRPHEFPTAGAALPPDAAQL
jgi:hypothetical protein